MSLHPERTDWETSWRGATRVIQSLDKQLRHWILAASLLPIVGFAVGFIVGLNW